MKEFEYLELFPSIGGNPKDSDDNNILVFYFNGNQNQTPKTLRELGKNGWELIQIQKIKDYDNFYLVAIFKREKR